MVAIDFQDLIESFEFVSMAPPCENCAYICLDTGRTYWKSELEPIGEELPDDLDTSDRFVMVPHPDDLGLGRELAQRFVRSKLPECAAEVDEIFRRKGAFSRFKNLLRSKSALERWYDYETEAAERALRDWCRDQGIQLIERGVDPGGQRGISPVP